MARGIEKGLSYGPLSKDFFTDKKVVKLRKRYDESFPYIYLALVFNLIYDEGYYIAWDDDIPLVLSELTGYDEQKCRAAIDAMFDVDLLSREMYETEKVLTSRGIQRQYQAITKQCRKKSGIRKYSLIATKPETGNVDESELMHINAEEMHSESELMHINAEEMHSESELMHINAEEMHSESELMYINALREDINATLMQQRKEKKRKVKEIKVKETSSFSSPTFFVEEKSLDEEEEKTIFKKIFFFRGFAHVDEAAEAFVRWNTAPGRIASWKRCSSDERILCANSWEEKDVDRNTVRPRFEPWAGTVFCEIHNRLARDSPELIPLLLNRRNTASADKRTGITLTVPPALQQWLESHVKDFLRPLMVKACTALGVKKALRYTHPDKEAATA